MTNPIIKRIELSDGRTITLETGKILRFRKISGRIYEKRRETLGL